MYEALLIVNPVSGKGVKKQEVNKIVNELQNLDFNVEIEYTQIIRNATQIIEEKSKNYDVLIILGGDGTLNEAVAALTEKSLKVSIGFIPLGTTNDFARSIGEAQGLLELPKNILNTKAKICDTGKFNNQYFNYIAAFGTFTSCSYATSRKAKKYFGRLAYVVKALQDVGRMKSYHLKLYIEDTNKTQTFEDDFVYGGISNSYYIGGFKWFKKDEIDLADGQLEAIFIRKPRNFIQMLIIYLELVFRKRDNKNVIYAKASNLQIETEEEIDWTLDGENAKSKGNIVISDIKENIEYIVPKK